MIFSQGHVDADFVDLMDDSREQAVLVVDRQSRIIRACNDAVATVLGYQPAELIGRTIEILHLDESHFRTFGAIVDREGRSGRPFNCRYQMRRRDGRLLEASYLFVPIVGPSGDVTTNVVIIRDVGGADANRHVLDLAINAIPVAAIVTRRADGRVLLANRACRIMFGASADDSLTDRAAPDFYPDPDDRQRMVDRLVRVGEVDDARIQLRRHDGSLFWASLSLRLVPYGDEDAVFATVTDVTTEHEARDAEQKARSLLESFVDNAPAQIYLKGLDGRYLMANRRLRERLADIGVDAIGSRAYTRFSPEDAAKLEAIDAEVTQRRTVVRQDVSMTPQGSDTRIFQITKFPVFDASGAVAAIGGISLDVTAEREAREAAEQIARNLRAIVDNAPAEIFLKDRDGDFILINRALREERDDLGIDRDDRKVHQPADLLPQLEAQDRKVFEQATIITDEAVIETASGPRVKRIIKFPVLDENGTVTAIGGIGIDITRERKARDAEQAVRRQLQAIIDHAPLHIYLKDRERKYILVNRSLREERERAGLAESDRSSYRLLSPEVSAKLARQDATVLDSGAIVVEELTARMAAGGETRTIRITKFPVYDEQGAIVALGGISLDVTEQRQLESRLRQAQKTEAVGQLTGGIAHDFNNLLAVVLGNAELLADDLAADPARRRMAELIRQAAERAAALTERLLAFSRQQELHPTAIDWRELVDGIVVLLRRTIPEDIGIATEIAPDLWPVCADRGQLENCLINLAVNARDAMPSGGTIRIAARNVTLTAADIPAGGELSPGAYVRLSVSDTGTGMTQEVQDRAFDPFFTTKEVGKGTGLGLSMAYGFARQSGGQISVRSTVGKGTTVVIDLPRAERDCASPSAAASPPAAVSDVPAGHETVLVVEDEPLVRSFVVAELRRLGYDVIEAQNGKEALHALRARPGIALLFTDLVMPGGMRGNELAREARAIAPGLKVLFTTGYANAFDGKTLPGDEDIAVLKKPYPRRELADYVRRCLDAAG